MLMVGMLVVGMLMVRTLMVSKGLHVEGGTG